jgi:hypothetical protein
MEVIKQPKGLLLFKLMGSINGEEPHFGFPLCDKHIRGAVEIKPGKILVAV